MTTTTYYDLNIVEGTDIVNPLTVDNPNYEKIDEVMHDNAISGVTLATEIANATVHAISRENSECAVIRFIATSEWKAGDSVTVDGVPVTALLPSGETLPDGAYVINANVLCILTGTNLTVFADRKKIDNAADIYYKNTKVSTELDKLNVYVNNLAVINVPPTTSSTFYGTWIYNANSTVASLIINVPYDLDKYDVVCSGVTVQGVGSYYDGLALTKLRGAIIIACTTGPTKASIGYLGTATLTFTKL